jgi:hypothetical protein
MKKLISLLGLLLYGIANAQVPTTSPFPDAPAPAVDISKYSFFIDSVTTINEIIQNFTAASTNTIAAQSIALGTTAAGVHQLYAKVTTTSGVPSIINLGNFYLEGTGFQFNNAPTAAVDINKYNFYIDSVTGVNELTQSFTAASTNSIPSQSITLGATPAGVHQLYAKVTTTNGVASIVNLGNFYLEGSGFQFNNIPTAAVDINTYSFYIDSVTNVNEIVQSFAAASTNTIPAQSIALGSTAAGVHQLYAKVTTTTGVPSIVNLGNFYLEGLGFQFNNTPTSAPNINRYTFFIDSVTSTNEQPLSFTPASTNTTPSNAIDLSGVLPGVHQLYAKVFDAAGKQSIVNLGNFSMTQNFLFPAAPTAAPPVSDLEYYIDDDPGFGLASPITVPGNTGNINLMMQSISIPTTLTTGNHILHIRSKQNPWSIDNAVTFSVAAILPVSWQYVKAQLINKNAVISWATSQEVNASHYEVEHSLDGINFFRLGNVNAVGNSSTTNQYSFTHPNIPVGLNYYRLKQVDINGASKYSSIVKLIQNDGIKNTIIAPNPVSNTLNIIQPSNNTIRSVSIIDMQGKIVLSRQINQTTQIYSLAVNELLKGTYILQIDDGKTKNNYSFIKL